MLPDAILLQSNTKNIIIFMFKLIKISYNITIKVIKILQFN